MTKIDNILTATDYDETVRYPGINEETGKLASMTEVDLASAWHEGQDAALAKGIDVLTVQRFFDYIPRKVFLPWLQALTEKANKANDKGTILLVWTKDEGASGSFETVNGAIFISYKLVKDYGFQSDSESVNKKWVYVLDPVQGKLHYVSKEYWLNVVAGNVENYTPLMEFKARTEADKQEMVNEVLANFTDVSEVGL